MGSLYISIAIFVLCFKIGQCAYCDQHTIPFPGVIKNMTRFYLSGESFEVSCETGYRVAVAKSRFTCKNGFWSGHFPPCIANDCLGPPPSMDHVLVKSYTGHHLSKVEYECEEHYFPEGDFKVQCNHGIWTGIKPICKDSRCYVHNLRHKEGIVISNANVTPSGEILDMKCSPGYELKGMKPFCTRGMWTEFGMSPCKEMNCTVDTVFNGAFVESTQKKVWRWDTFKRERTEVFKKVRLGQQKFPGTVLHIVCEAPFTFQGKGSHVNTTICSKGNWVPRPICH